MQTLFCLSYVPSPLSEQGGTYPSLPYPYTPLGCSQNSCNFSSVCPHSRLSSSSYSEPASFILKSLPARFSFNFLSSICKACDLACLWGLLEGSRPAANSGAFPFFFFYYSLSMMPTHICVLSRVTRWLRICCPISSRRYYLSASPDKDELNLNTKKVSNSELRKYGSGLLIFIV